jgi:microcystin-dependent protein
MAVQFLQRKNDIDISRLTAESTPVSTDLLYIEKGSGSGDLRRKITFTNLLSSVASGIVNTIVPTGIIVPWLSSAAPSGWIMASGRTIGSATSGATERANADTANLYALLWASFSNTELPIQDSSGAPSVRGSSAANDYAANKRLPLPDARGRSVFGLDNVSNSGVIGRITTAGSGINGETIGATGGAQTITLISDNLPSHTHTVTVAYPAQIDPAEAADISNAGSTTVYIPNTPETNTPSPDTFTSSATGSGTAINKVPPAIILPWIVKL